MQTKTIMTLPLPFLKSSASPYVAQCVALLVQSKRKVLCRCLPTDNSEAGSNKTMFYALPERLHPVTSGKRDILKIKIFFRDKCHCNYRVHLVAQA